VELLQFNHILNEVIDDYILLTPRTSYNFSRVILFLL